MVSGDVVAARLTAWLAYGVDGGQQGSARLLH